MATLLNSVKGKSYFCKGIFSIGAYIDNNGIVLIDSGSDESSAKTAYNALEGSGDVIAIINTHCHPDHCGGNYFFQKRYPSLKVFAAHDEKNFIEDPTLAPRCFCQQAAPFAGLRNKHIAPQRPSVITDVIAPYQDQKITIDGIDFTIITLPGHTPGSIGIITPDNILYSGDALFGQETLHKHPILFYTDIGNTLASFKKLSQLQVDACVLYHGGVINNLPAIVEQHEKKILETKEMVLSIIKSKDVSIDLLTQQVMQKYRIPGNIVSFTLTQTAMRAYITQLEAEKSIEIKVIDGLLVAAPL